VEVVEIEDAIGEPAEEARRAISLTVPRGLSKPASGASIWPS